MTTERETVKKEAEPNMHQSMNKPIDFNGLRIIDRDGDPWFDASDLINRLDPMISAQDAAMEVLDQMGVLARIGEDGKFFTIIPEGAAYRLIWIATAPDLPLPADFVMDHAFPTIRRTGEFSPMDTGPSRASPYEIALAADLVLRNNPFIDCISVLLPSLMCHRCEGGVQ